MDEGEGELVCLESHMPILNALLLSNNKRYRNDIFTAFKYVLWYFIVDETDRLIVWLSKVKHEFFLNISK